jgi:hypothetical protein
LQKLLKLRVINPFTMLKKTLKIFLVFIICNYYSANGQESDLRGWFKSSLEECKLIYKEPNGYEKTNTCDTYESYPGYLHNLLLHSIKNKREGIIIVFAMVTIKEPNELLKKMFPKSAEINTILPYLINEADSTLSTPIHIDEKKLQKLNADNGYIYNLRVVYPYLDKYPFCKKVIIHKDNVSNAEILFFYTKKEENKVDEVIRKTWGMLKFKD